MAADTGQQTITCTVADTEYPFTVPIGHNYVSVQCRTSAAVRIADTTGLVATPTDPFATIKADGAWDAWLATGNAQVFYLAGGTGGEVVEVFTSYSQRQ